MNKIIRLTESQLNSMILEGIMNEISQQAKAGGLVKADQVLDNLRQARNKGQKQINKNGRVVDVNDEISRKERQQKAFGRGLAHDLSLEVGKNKDFHNKNIENYRSKIADIKNNIQRIQNNPDMTNSTKAARIDSLKSDLARATETLRGLMDNTNGYNVNSYGDGSYSIETPEGRAYTTDYTNGIQYDQRNNDSANVNRLSKLQGVTDAMSGYSDELSGRSEKRLDNLRRQQKNVKAINDYDRAYDEWSANDRAIKQSQSDYDRQPFFKKMFTQRPADGPQPPIKPKWNGNENGEFDGYFGHEKAEDYEKDIDDTISRRNSYKDAKNKYFKK